MFAELATQTVPWDSVADHQVDEWVAPPDDPDRYLRYLTEALGLGPGEGNEPCRSMRTIWRPWQPLRRASLPEHFDLVHLGLGPRAHRIAEPGDPVLSVTDRLVALTRPYQGRVRMTLTYPASARARQILWLVTGSDKRIPWPGSWPATLPSRRAVRGRGVTGDGLTARAT